MNPQNVDYAKLLEELLYVANENDASDIHLKADSLPYLRIKGELIPCGGNKLSNDFVRNLIFETMKTSDREVLDKFKEVDYAYLSPTTGIRYRVNAYTAQSELEAVFRIIKTSVKSTKELRLPSTIDKLSEMNDGLILVAGATGTGKSTTLAAMIDHINLTQNKRIITIENPVEIIHKDKKSVISQREVGGDTISFEVALRSVLRQNPDIILIGEIRDKETANSALQAAQTGHLVLSTIHASSAEETIQRFASLYPAEERTNIKRALAFTLKGVLAQKLIVDVEGNKLPVLEIMTSTDRIMQAVLADAEDREGESLTTIIEQSEVYGMLSLDQYLVKLVKQGLISVNVALSTAANALTLNQKLHRIGLISN